MKPTQLMIPAGIDAHADSGRWNGFDSPVSTTEDALNSAIDSTLDTPEDGQSLFAPIWNCDLPLDARTNERLIQSVRQHGHLGAPSSIYEPFAILGSRQPYLIGLKSPGAYQAFMHASKGSMGDHGDNVQAQNLFEQKDLPPLPFPHIPRASRIPRWSLFLQPTRSRTTAPSPGVVPQPSSFTRSRKPSSVKLKVHRVNNLKVKRDSASLSFFALFDPETGGMLPFKGYQLPRSHTLRPKPGPGLPVHPKAGNTRPLLLKSKTAPAAVMIRPPRSTSLKPVAPLLVTKSRKPRVIDATLPIEEASRIEAATAPQYMGRKRKPTTTVTKRKSVISQETSSMTSPTAQETPATPIPRVRRPSSASVVSKRKSATSVPSTSAARAVRGISSTPTVSTPPLSRTKKKSLTSTSSTKSINSITTVARPTTPAKATTRMPSPAASHKPMANSTSLSLQSSASGRTSQSKLSPAAAARKSMAESLKSSSRSSTPTPRSKTPTRSAQKSQHVPPVPPVPAPSVASKSRTGTGQSSMKSSATTARELKTGSTAARESKTSTSTASPVTSSLAKKDIAEDGSHCDLTPPPSSQRPATPETPTTPTAAGHSKTRSLPATPPDHQFLRPVLPKRSATDGDQRLVDFGAFGPLNLGRKHTPRAAFLDFIDGDKALNRNFSIHDEPLNEEAYYENPELCSPPVAFYTWDLPGHDDCDPDLTSRFSTSTTSTSNYVDIDFPPVLEEDEEDAFDLPDDQGLIKKNSTLGMSMDSLSGSAMDLFRANAVSPVSSLVQRSKALCPKTPPSAFSSKHASLMGRKTRERVPSFLQKLKRVGGRQSVDTLDYMGSATSARS